MTLPQTSRPKTIDRKWLVFIAIGTGSFMVALDGSVVNAILPILRDTFSSSVATIEWVVTIYLLVLSGLLLSFGRLGDLRGHRSLYILGFVVFVASSALCGLAWSAGILIFFRGLQAIGGASWLVLALVVLVLGLLTGLVLALITMLAGLAYNFLASATGGVVVNAAVVDDQPTPGGGQQLVLRRRESAVRRKRSTPNRP